MEYHRTKDILHAMQRLGHKNIKNTFIYVQLAEDLFKDQQEYVSKVAKTEVDICAVVDAGFEFVCEHNGARILGSENIEAYGKDSIRWTNPRYFTYNWCGI